MLYMQKQFVILLEMNKNTIKATPTALQEWPTGSMKESFKQHDFVWTFSFTPH